MGDQVSGGGDHNGDHGPGVTKNQAAGRLRPWEIRLYIVLLLAGFCFTWYWTFFDRAPSFTLIAFNVEPEIIEQDKQFAVKFETRRDRLCERTEVTRTFLDSKGYRHTFSDLIFNEPASGLGPYNFVHTLRMPQQAALGGGVLEYRIAWFCNPLQNLFGRPVVRRYTKYLMVMPDE